ncbi:hypothetical protein DXG01_012130 [Tephrocybe rancida]|nr:hypothetical protein DXG01_012130 [Tephrocybe rancida]
MRSIRNFCMKESGEPKVPLEIGDQMFQLVADHLGAIEYAGPVGLGCDNTKLFSSLQLFWDSGKKAYSLVGGTEGPVEVVDPEALKEIMVEAKVKKATKIRLWVLTIPAPKVTPIIVAALPIPNDHTVNSLLV